MKIFNKKYKHLWLLLLCAILISNTFLVNVGYAYDSVQVLYKCGNTNVSTSNITPWMKIANNGTSNIRLSDVKVRYWFTRDTSVADAFYCDYAAVGTANVTGTFVTLATPVSGADCYLELSFNQSAGIIGSGSDTGDIQVRIAKPDYSTINQGNDYSFDPTLSAAYAPNPKITAYIKGVLVYGTDLTTGAIAPAAPTPGPFNVNLTIDPSQERAAISPYIYGTNQDLTGAEGWTARRMGGNRMTAYNWENNASNAGSDWNQNSDNFVTANEGVPASQENIPGIGVTTFVDKSHQMNVPYSLVTLQMAGYVAKDKNGPVSAAETAPSARWVPVVPAKGSAFSLTPDTTDNAVYMDEEVNFLVNKYGNASTATGIKGYDLDNEPALWPNTHPRVHPATPTCAELISKSVALAKAVKNVDPYAEIFGPVAYGMAEYASFQGASDWTSLQGNYSWFLDYYLDQMKQASTTAGKRLMDVLDVHWYPEAYGGGTRICSTSDGTNVACNKERLQAPRTLWDPTYLENGWIAQWCPQYLPLIPKLKSTIDTYYPGTKLSVTEFNYGGDNHITGGIATADVLGIFGKYGVYLGTYWAGSGACNYVSAAYKLYRNYDGAGATYGDTKVKAETSDVENSSVYASIVGTDDSKLHIIVMNKNYDYSGTYKFNIGGTRSYTSGRVWSLDGSSSNITEKTAIQSISGNSFSYTIPPLTVCHIVLSSGTGPTTTPTPTVSAATATPTPTPSTATATPTPTPSTATATPTPTPSTATPTPTPTPSTATPTPTPSTATPTPTPSTATPTPTPTAGTPTPGGIKVQFFNGNTAASTNTIYPNFKVVNTGTAAINLSDVKVRYYFTNDGTQANSFACDYSTAGSGNITSSFATIAKTNADRYLEVGFTSAAGTLAAGASAEVKGRVWKSDWSNFTQTNDYSFNATATNYVDATTVTGYIAGALKWGTEP